MGVIKKPLITEKFTDLSEKLGKYAFVCSPKASKEEIKTEIESLYGVTVDSINTMIYSGKKKYRYTKRNIFEGKTSRYKKAVVTLKEGDEIDFYANI